MHYFAWCTIDITNKKIFLLIENKFSSSKCITSIKRMNSLKIIFIEH